MKILFLDDDPNRTLQFKGRTLKHDVTTVETPEEAFEALDKHSRFDIASLDHDLFGKIYQPSDEKSGWAVANHIEEMENSKQPLKVICHSYNPDGVAAMTATLTNGIAEPFNSPEYWEHF